MQGTSSRENAMMTSLPRSSTAGDGINRNVCVLPDLEQALMDFMPDLKREPQGRFDAGTDNTGCAEDNVISDDTDCMETDAGLYNIRGQYDDYSQTINGNGFMPVRGMEYAEVSGMTDDVYDDETYSQEYDRDGYSADEAEDSTELTSDNDDFDRRWEEAGQNGTESNGFPLSPLNDQASAKGFNIFGLPFGFGIPDMDRKQSFT